MRAMKKRTIIDSFPALDPLYYNDEGVMIGHKLVPMDRPSEGVLWCRVCGGHPTDPIHQTGWVDERDLCA